MLPFAFEWHWDIGHFIFMGLFYLALSVVFGTLGYCIFSTIKDMFSGEYLHHHHEEHDEEGHEA
jgi:hypothetical protein